MLIPAGLAVFVTGGELACLLPKIWEKMEVSVTIFARKYGFSRATTFRVVNQTVPRSTLGYENIIGYPVRDFSGILLACASSHMPMG